MANPTIVIVGRPNVDESTISNRTAGVRISIIENTPGVTHDRAYTTGEWLRHEFSIIDIGGIDLGDEPFMDQIKHQAEIVIDEMDVIIFVTNGREGITDAGELVAKILCRSNKPTILAANKADNPEMRNDICEFYALGLGDSSPVSGNHGLGIGNVLDKTARHFPNTPEEGDKDTIKFSLTGRPNVDKSLLINAILGKDHVIVSDIKGTTRDAIDTYFKSEEGQKFLAINIADMCKHGKICESTEKYNVIHAIRATERLDTILVVLNVEEGIREQDRRVVGCTHKTGRGTIIVINK